MKTTLKLQLIPTDEQVKRFKQFSNTARFIYNWGLGEKKKAYELDTTNLKLQDLIKLLQDLKYNNPDYKWIHEVPESVTKQSLKDLMGAYKKFFERGNKGFPKFKSKKYTDLSFYQRTDNFYFIDSTKSVNISGVGKVKVNNYIGNYPNKVENPRVKYDGKYWWLTVSYDVEVSKEVLSDLVIGVDLGIKKLAVRSDGVEVCNINKSKRVKQLEKRLKRLQRKVSKKYEMNKQCSKYVKTFNILKLESDIKLVHRKLKNIRLNHLHNATSDIVKTKPCRVVLEDLNVSGMLKNKHLSRAISNQGFSTFRSMMKYKCERAGIDFVLADRWFASSKICSSCSTKKQSLSLSERIYVCESCGLVLDRDLNAALNLSNYK